MRTKEYKNVSHFGVRSIHVSYTENSQMSSAVITTNWINFSSLTWKDEMCSESESDSTTANGKVFQSFSVFGTGACACAFIGRDIKALLPALLLLGLLFDALPSYANRAVIDGSVHVL